MKMPHLVQHHFRPLSTRVEVMPAGLSIFKSVSVRAALEHRRGGVEFETETVV